jgi:excisionase family DNA binding protein
MQTIKPKSPMKKSIDYIKSDYYTVKELSEYLKISQSHIYTMTSKRSIPHIKVAEKKVLFNKADIEAWLNDKKVSAE